MPKHSKFEAELALFEKHRKDWSKSHAGEFVVISAGNVGGFFADYDAALRAGIKSFGVRAEFLIKQVWSEEPVYLIY